MPAPNFNHFQILASDHPDEPTVIHYTSSRGVNGQSAVMSDLAAAFITGIGTQNLSQHIEQARAGKFSREVSRG